MRTLSISAHFLGTSVAAIAIAAGAPLHAQSPGEASVSDSQGLTDIVVTAQRRSQNIQDVPIAVSALTAGQLAAKGSTSSEDLTAAVPGVVFNTAGGGGQITIRGIGGTNSGVDAGNAVYVDGVYQFAPGSNIFDFNGIERIEILKGPQGTLFGRNSAGGLVHVITREPTQQRAIEASVGYANYDTISGNAYINAPLTDTIAVNVATFGWKQNDGWGRNLADGSDVHTGYSWGARGKLKWEAPDGNTDMVLSASYSKSKPVSSQVAPIVPGTLSITGDPSPGIYNSNTDAPNFQLFKQYTFSGTLHHDFGSVRLTSITAYDHAEATLTLDYDYTPNPIAPVSLFVALKTFSQEVHLQSSGSGPLEWLIGGLYLDNTTPGINDLGPFGLSSSTTKTRSYAVFGQATYALTDTTKVTAGLRYTDDRATLKVGSGPAQEARAKKPTWRLALDHKLSQRVLIYGSYARGFKSGLFNSTYPAAGAADPQQLDAFEIGLKAETTDRRARFNLAAFHYDFKKVQVQLFAPGSLAYIANAGNATTNGIDVDMAVEPVRNLTLTLAGTYLDSKFTNSPAGFNCYQPIPTGGLGTFPCGLKGNRLAFAPKLTFSLGAEYRVPTNVGDLTFSVLDAYNSGYFADPSNFDLTATGKFNRVNASVGWLSPSKSLNATLWVKNLFDERTIGGANLTPPFGASVYPMPPRTYGVSLGFKF